jgi:Predicted transcriptional regulators
MKTPKTRGTTIMMTPGRAQPDLTTYKGRFGSHIRTIREKLKLTQQEVADACGVTPGTVGRWENSSELHCETA